MDLLAESEIMSEEVFNKKLTRMFTLKDLDMRFPKDGPEGNPAWSLPPDLEKNIQKGLTFKITEYSTLIF